MNSVCTFLLTVVFLGTKLIPFFGSSNIDEVIDAYYYALFAVRPRRRYVVGLDARLMQLASLLPSSILDRIFLSPVLRAVPASCQHWSDALILVSFCHFFIQRTREYYAASAIFHSFCFVDLVFCSYFWSTGSPDRKTFGDNRSSSSFHSW